MRRNFRFLVLFLLLASGVGGGGVLWWRQQAQTLPEGIVWGNGRIEANEIDIATKFSGRVAEILVEEGDLVTANQVLARMDTKDLEASLRKAEADALQDRHNLEFARAEAAQRKSQMQLAHQELQRAESLVRDGLIPRQQFDQRQSDRDTANAAYASALARIGQAEQAVNSAIAETERIKIDIADGTLVAPRAGRIQYRLADPGEVAGAGGKILTMLDLSDVYMAVFLPTNDVGRTTIGADARIVLDALPDLPIPAKVTFIAVKAQFTPKTVETRSERERLMFRVKVRIDPALLSRHVEEIRTGLPGVAYVRLDPKVEWPARLQTRPFQ